MEKKEFFMAIAKQNKLKAAEDLDVNKTSNDSDDYWEGPETWFLDAVEGCFEYPTDAQQAS